MRRIWIALAGVIVVGVLALPAVAQQEPAQPSLADAARAARQNRKTGAKVYDNDNLPKQATISITGAAPAEDSAKKDDAAPSDDKAATDKAAADKAVDDLKSKISDRKKTVADLTREIDLMQREQKLKTAIAYADAGTKLRDDKKWQDDERKFQQDLADRQQKLADAQKALDDLRDQGRKAGLSASALE